MAKRREIWITADGMEFEDEAKAIAHESSLEKVFAVEKFLIEALECTDRKRAEYLSVFKQFFIWESGGWERPAKRDRAA